MLRACALRFSADGIHYLFQDLTFHLEDGLVGLMGPNGHGKSSLLRVLLRELEAPKPFYLPQINAFESWEQCFGPSLYPIVKSWIASEKGEADADDLRCLEDYWDAIAAWPEEAERWGVAERFWELNGALLNGGQIQRLRLALTELFARDQIFLDEPTHHLDAEGRALLFAFLENFSGLCLCVSHDRDLLRLMATIMHLEAGQLSWGYAGYDAFMAEQEAARERAIEACEVARLELRKAKLDAQAVREKQEKRTAQGRRSAKEGGLPRIMIGTRKRNAEKTAARIEITQADRVQVECERLKKAQAAIVPRLELHVDFKTKSARGLIMRAEKLIVCPGGKPLWDEGLSFEIRAGERVRLRGANGAGKTSLLRCILGEDSYRGILKGPRSVVCLDQKLALLDGGRNLVEHWRDELYIPDEAFRRTIAGRLGLARMIEKPFLEMSGGERMRAALCLLATLHRPPELLLLDEPSNHLDGSTQEALIDSLAALPSALIVISHEEGFVEALEVDQEIVCPKLLGSGGGIL